jgi:hypothetical protein
MRELTSSEQFWLEGFALIAMVCVWIDLHL